MTIKEIREKGVGVTVEGLIANVDVCKHTPKELPSGEYTQQVVLADNTGKLLATFPLGRQYIPMQREHIKVLSGILENTGSKTYGGVELLVESWESDNALRDDWEDQINLQVRGKIKCLYIAAMLRRTDAVFSEVLKAAKSPKMKELIDETMKG